MSYSMRYIKIAVSIGLVCFIIFFQILTREQQKNLEEVTRFYEAQKCAYKKQKQRWSQDSIRRAHEIQLLDSALYRIHNSR